MSIHARDFALTEWVLGCVRDLWSFKAHQISLEGQGLALKTGIQWENQQLPIRSSPIYIFHISQSFAMFAVNFTVEILIIWCWLQISLVISRTSLDLIKHSKTRWCLCFIQMHNMKTAICKPTNSKCALFHIKWCLSGFNALNTYYCYSSLTCELFF